MVGQQPRARDLGIAPGILQPGAFNAITDVAGVRVGHLTLIEGAAIRTGVTVILAHEGSLFQDKVPAGLSVGNGYGKFVGVTQIEELGEVETPIGLTNTLSAVDVASGLIAWTLAQPGNEAVRSVNAVVGETNDSFVNDIRARAIRPAHAADAIRQATSGPVAEGCVGAGTGTRAFDWKGGIGTSSRVLPAAMGSWTIGVLVQTNYGGVLDVMGAPVGKALGQHDFVPQLAEGGGDGSVVFIIATDAPLSSRNLKRLAARAHLALGRTGSCMANGSGDYALAFSTALSVRRTPARRDAVSATESVPNDALTPLFQAVVEAAEESIYNALIAARTVETPIGKLEKLPLDRLQAVLTVRG
jgi:D-aminopeptidase